MEDFGTSVIDGILITTQHLLQNKYPPFESIIPERHVMFNLV